MNPPEQPEPDKTPDFWHGGTLSDAQVRRVVALLRLTERHARRDRGAA